MVEKKNMCIVGVIKKAHAHKKRKEAMENIQAKIDSIRKQLKPYPISRRGRPTARTKRKAKKE